jgi:hypothetical protein
MPSGCDRHADLAALEVPRGIDDQFRVRFFELPESAVTPPVGTPVVMRGFPSDLAMPLGQVLASFAIMQWGRIQEEPVLGKFDPGSEFLVKFVLAGEGKRPHGFSGAGAWFHKAPGAVWHPSLGLAGVCTSYFPRRALLSITRVEVVTAFLDSVFPA